MAIAESKVNQRLVSADSHVTIPDDSFLAHVPRKHLDVATRFVADAKASMGELQKQVLAEGKGPQTNWPAQGRPGDHDQAERIKDQDIDGVEAEVLYSQSTVGVDGGPLYAIGDHTARDACFQAYNDTLAEWIQAAPKRLIPVGVVPVADVEQGVAELDRLAKLGFRAATVPTYPDLLGLPHYWDERYQPLWRAFADHGIPLSLHTAVTKGLTFMQEADPTPAKAIFQSLPPIHMAELVSSWILGGMLPRNPDLHLVLVESGIGWIAYYLERLDTMFRRHNWAHRGVIQELPSTYWKRQFHATFEDDEVGLRTLDRLGVDNVMWASDYPHPDSTWPESQKVVETDFKDLSPEDKEKIVWKNAAQLYRLD
jgi:uncharacterized protein